METIGKNIEVVSIPRTFARHVSASDNAAIDIHIAKEQEKNARGPMQIIRARKPQFLIVDEEWW